jgi:signal transduction histidine kinase
VERPVSFGATHLNAEVTNDGPSIVPSELARLFEPLQRLEPGRATHPDGHGLGLSIVKAIADAHNARITTHTRPGGGLAIEVRFPTSTLQHSDHRLTRDRFARGKRRVVSATS